jgi:uncharacterized protein YhhL (DUF1145 family)
MGLLVHGVEEAVLKIMIEKYNAQYDEKMRCIVFFILNNKY